MSNKFKEYWSAYERFLRDKSQPWSRLLDSAERTVGTDRTYIVTGAVAFVLLYLIFGIGCELICNSIAVVYPAYMSMKALESPQKDDDTKWLTYWTVYATFSVLEYFSDFIVGWFPLYWFLKCLFFVWCFNPTEYNGSLVIYNRVIRPYYQKNHGRIDQMAGNDRKMILDHHKERVIPTYEADTKILDPHEDVKDVMKRLSRKIDRTIDKNLAKFDNVVNRGMEALEKKFDRKKCSKLANDAAKLVSDALKKGS